MTEPACSLIVAGITADLPPRWGSDGEGGFENYKHAALPALVSAPGTNQVESGPLTSR
jgi:hypothetical protein